METNCFSGVFTDLNTCCRFLATKFILVPTKQSKTMLLMACNIHLYDYDSCAKDERHR